MRHIRLIAIGCMVAAVSAGCASSGRPKLVAAADDQSRAVMLEQVKKMSGTWDMLDDKGAVIGTTVFAVCSGGSAVREVMFQGMPHEMTNMYHMDGGSMVMTHYCAEGNQPRMRAGRADASPGRIAFRFDSATNYTDTERTCMGEMTLTIKDDTHASQAWQSYQGAKTNAPFTIQLRRRS